MPSPRQQEADRELRRAGFDFTLHMRRLCQDAVARVEPFEIELGEAGRFPPRGRPRILWRGVGPAGPLTALARRLEDAARELGFRAEERPFRPHLTLARARRGERATLPAGDDPLPAAGPFRVERATLFRSVLHPSGARYTALDHFPLRTGLN